MAIIHQGAVGLPRERVRTLLDPVSPFLEVGQLAAHGMYGGEAPSAGIVTGIGRVHERQFISAVGDGDTEEFPSVAR